MIFDAGADRSGVFELCLAGHRRRAAATASYWRRLALTHWARQEYPAALEAANRSLNLVPEQSNTAAFAGYCLLLQHKAQEALKLSSTPGGAT
jgi:hypothetical protein